MLPYLRRFKFFVYALAMVSGPVIGQNYVVSTAAGDTGPLDGIGTVSYFGGPWQVAVRDSIAYITDNGNGALRKINLKTKAVTTLLENEPRIAGLALSKGGDSLFFSSQDNIIRLYRISTQTTSTVDTVVDNPIDAMVCDRKGNLYFAGGFSHRIRRLDPTGVYKTVAGKLNTEGLANGLDTLARFNRISSLIFSRTEDTLYISDRFNSRIRRLHIPTRQVTTIAAILTLFGPRQLAFNPKKDTLYICNSSAHSIYRYAVKTNVGAMWCGLAGTAGYKDSTLMNSRFNYPNGLAYSDSGLICADNSNQRVRRISKTGNVTTLAGVGVVADGTGTNCRFNVPFDVMHHPGKDTLYISDQATHAIRRYNLQTGHVTTLAGNGKSGKADGVGLNAFLNGPAGLEMSRTGDTLFFCEPFANKIRMVNTKTGEVKWLAGSDTAGYVDRPQGRFARFRDPYDLARYGDTLFIADQSNHKIRIYNIKTGAVTTFAGSTLGFKDTVRLFSKFNRPITVEVVGKRLFIGEDGGLRIRVIHLDTNRVRNWAGSGAFNNEDGFGAQAKFRGIRKMTYDPARKFLFVGGYVNEGFLRGVFVDIPYVGTFNSLTGYLDGPLGTAKFKGPLGCWTDTLNHKIYIADAGNNRIRSILQIPNEPPTAQVDTVATILEDAPLTTLDGVASQMSPGVSPAEANQSWTFTIRSTPKSRVVNEAVMFPNGSLSVMPAHDSTGSVDLRIKMKDNGGTLAQGVDSAIYHCKLKIMPVNDPPVFRISGNDTSLAGTVRKRAGWIDSSAGGPWDERNQPITYTLLVDHPTWFTQPPAIVNDTLIYTTLAGISGVSNVTIVGKDNGGTDNGGLDEAVPQTFQIVLMEPLGMEALRSGRTVAWPNPAFDQLHIANVPTGTTKVQWMNVLGKVVAEENVSGDHLTLLIPDEVTGPMWLNFTGRETTRLKVMVVR